MRRKQTEEYLSGWIYVAVKFVSNDEWTVDDDWLVELLEESVWYWQVAEPEVSQSIMEEGSNA